MRTSFSVRDLCRSAAGRAGVAGVLMLTVAAAADLGQPRAHAQDRGTTASVMVPPATPAAPAAAQAASALSADGTVTGTGRGDGAAALEVDPSEITADSLISRHQAAPRDPGKGPVTNLPLPRYVSLKGGEGNARRGPSLSHRIDWVFRHPGMPLRVVAEFGHWRRIEDQDGAGGWVHYSLLSGVRTAIVTTDMAELRARADQNGPIIARAEAGAIVRLHECVKDWCRVSGGGEKGWVVKTSLWGVDADEIRE